MSSSVIKGQKELVAKFKRLDQGLQGQACESAVLSGLLVIQNAAIEKVPVRKHILQRSIHSEITSSSGSKVLGQCGTDLEYAAIQEFGGQIDAKKAPFLAFQVNGNWVRVKSVRIPAQPYMRPAYDENKDQARDEVGAALWAIIQGLI